VRLKEGKLLHRLLVALASDGYRPARVTTLHFHLYPREYFNPSSSPGRVYQRIDHLRRWLKARRFPMTVDQQGGFFHLVAKAPCRLRVGASPLRAGRTETLVEKLRDAWPRSEFSAKDAGRHLLLPARATQRVLQKALAADLLEREGSGYHTRYRLKRSA
jgi:hypothetical protein